MDSTQVLPKLSLLIWAISSMAEKANLNNRRCQSLAGSLRNLAPLINELQEYNVPIIGGAITSFEGLEHALCQAKSFLEKCSGGGSKLYMVCRRDNIFQKFRLMVAEIESHVNMLPMGALQLTQTTQQQVMKCITELRETMYDVEGEESLLLDLKAALRELKGGGKLSHDTLDGLARKFDLKLNQNVLREAALLEKEREVAKADKDKAEEELINQLLVLVTKMGDDLAEQKQAQVEFGGIPVPADFRCPLSLELMSDPVIVASGQTYERGYIQEWLDQGNTTCPKTRQTLNHTNLIPNYTVKALIASWCEANHVPFPESMKLSGPLTLVVGGVRDVHLSPASPQSPLSHGNGSGWSPTHSRLQVSEAFCGHRPRKVVNGDSNGHFLSSGSRKVTFNGGDLANSHSRNTSSSSVASSADDTLFTAAFDDNSIETAQQPIEEPFHCIPMQRPRALPSLGSSNHGSSGVTSLSRLCLSSSRRLRGSDQNVPPRLSIPPPQALTAELTENDVQVDILHLVSDLKSGVTDVERNAATALRYLAKHSPENRKKIANCGAIEPLVALLDTKDPETLENAVTALLNLSIDDNNKNEIAAAGAIDPLVKVLRLGNYEVKANSAATLFSLSVMDENKLAVGQSGAIPPLVDLLKHGTPRGKKDAATALFNLSILHENKARIVGAGAIKPLVELMTDPAAGMVDKAVAVLANLATVGEGKTAIGEEGGIPALVEVIELGSQRGKENAAAALLHLCTSNHRFRAMVLQEGAIPPLVALSQSGTARAKEKASALLRHFREQRQAVLGRGMRERHMDHLNG